MVKYATTRMRIYDSTQGRKAKNNEPALRGGKEPVVLILRAVGLLDGPYFVLRKNGAEKAVCARKTGMSALLFSLPFRLLFFIPHGTAFLPLRNFMI